MKSDGGLYVTSILTSRTVKTDNILIILCDVSWNVSIITAYRPLL